MVCVADNNPWERKIIKYQAQLNPEKTGFGFLGKKRPETPTSKYQQFVPWWFPTHQSLVQVFSTGVLTTGTEKTTRFERGSILP